MHIVGQLRNETYPRLRTSEFRESARAAENGFSVRHYLAAKFEATHCHMDLYPGTKLPHQISGRGNLFELSKPITGSALLEEIKTYTRNFRNGFSPLRDRSIIYRLEALAS